MVEIKWKKTKTISSLFRLIFFRNYSPYIEYKFSAIIFISHSLRCQSYEKTVAYIVHLPFNTMSIDLKNIYAASAKSNIRLERFKEIKSFYLAHKLEVPPHVMEEYSDILV